MNSVTVHNLPVGSYIDKPVYLDENFILLTPDIPITEEMKQRLTSWGMTKVFTDGTPIESPPELTTSQDNGNGQTATAHMFESTEKEKIEWQETLEIYESMCGFLTEVFDRYIKKENFDINQITERVKSFIQSVKQKRKYILRINEMPKENFSYLVTHSVKVAIISLILSDAMKLPPFRQIDIGIAGLLHEAGMLRIPSNLYMNSNVLSPQQKKTIAAHTVLGFRILKTAQFSTPITRAVLEHHERVDGTGYPRSITGDKISFYAKIVAVACSYVAIVSDRPHRGASDGHSGILELLKNTGKKYDEQVIKILVFALSIYPIGTFVLLSTQSRAVVVETDSKNPRYPVVRLLVDENGTPYRNQPLLQIKENEGAQIVRPLTKNEIEEIKSRM